MQLACEQAPKGGVVAVKASPKLVGFLLFSAVLLAWHAEHWREEQAPRDALTACLPGLPCTGLQVQYPDALPTMALDLSNIRLAAAFLSKVRANRCFWCRPVCRN